MQPVPSLMSLQPPQALRQPQTAHRPLHLPRPLPPSSPHLQPLNLYRPLLLLRHPLSPQHPPLQQPQRAPVKPCTNRRARFAMPLVSLAPPSLVTRPPGLPV